jgi:hypothetical protein
MQIQSKIHGGTLTPGPKQEGALGCFALDEAGHFVLLTNSHVMFPNFVAVPHQGVYQPNYSSCCSSGDKIATAVFDQTKVKDGRFKGGFKIKLGAGVIPAPNELGFTTTKSVLPCSETDCAIARLDPGVTFKNVWKTATEEIPINGENEDVLSILGPKAGTAPAPNQYVRVYTPRDGGKLIFATLVWQLTDNNNPDKIEVDGELLTPIYENGFVFGSPEEMDAQGGMPSINQLVLLPRPKPIPGEPDYTKHYRQPNQELSFDHGDSGSVVIDHQNRVIAQIVGGFPFIPAQHVRRPAERTLIEFTAVNDKNVAIASPIRGIKEQLKITIPPAVFSGTVPSGGAGARVFVPGFPADPHIAAERQTAEQLREGLRASRRGKLLLGKIGQHRYEVHRLLVTVRAISTAWRDLNGPRFYHHCVQSARDAEHLIPTSINGVTRSQLAEVLLPLFASHGSPELRRDIDRYGGWAGEALLHISTLDEVPESVARRRPPQ